MPPADRLPTGIRSCWLVRPPPVDRAATEPTVRLLGFVAVTVAAVGIVPLIEPAAGWSPWTATGLLAQVLLVGLLVHRSSPLFLPAVFFLVLQAVRGIAALPAIWWSVSVVIAAGTTLVVQRFDRSPGLPEAPVAMGRLGYRIIGAAIVVGAASVAGLVAWVVLARPDLAALLAQIPPVGAPLLVLGLVGFALLNAVGEEVAFRGVFMAALSTGQLSLVPVLLTQAAFFGLCHAAGFPSGSIGVALAFGYGLLLGWLRQVAGGLAACIGAHIVADVTIGILVLVAGGRL